MTTVIQWLLRGSNGIVVLGLVFAVVGTFYSAPDLFKQRAPLLGEVAQCLITGAIGGLAFGVGVTLTMVPVALLFNKSLYKHTIPRNDVFAFINAMLASAPISSLLMGVKQAFVFSMISGIVLGCSIGFITSFFSLLQFWRGNKRSVVSNGVLQNSYSKDMLIAWMFLGVAFGAILWTLFGNVSGVFLGLLVGWVLFKLGLHPKPEPVQNSSRRDILIRISRIVGFWLFCVCLIGMILLRLFLLFMYDTLLGFEVKVFLLVVLLLFFGYLIYQGARLERRKNKISIVSNQTNLGKATLVVDRLKIFRSITTGIICGLLLFGCAYGIPVAFIFGQSLGIGIAGVVFLLFCLLGLGFGSACGIVFCYIYNFKFFITLKITSLSERTLRIIGLALTVVGIVLSILPSLVW